MVRMGYPCAEKHPVQTATRRSYHVADREPLFHSNGHYPMYIAAIDSMVAWIFNCRQYPISCAGPKKKYPQFSESVSSTEIIPHINIIIRLLEPMWTFMLPLHQLLQCNNIHVLPFSYELRSQNGNGDHSAWRIADRKQLFNSYGHEKYWSFHRIKYRVSSGGLNSPLE